MPSVDALKKSDAGMKKSSSLGSLMWASTASMNTPRKLIVQSEALSSSTYSLNWSGVQAHTKKINKRKIHVDGETGLGSTASLYGTTEILSPTGVLTPGLAITAIASVFGNSFNHGYNTGVLNSPSGLIKDFLNETLTTRFGAPPSAGVLEIVWATTVSIYLIGGCAGAFSAGWLADRFGRNKALLLMTIFSFLGAILFGSCKAAGSFEMIILGRLVVGYGCGAGSGLVPMYLTEISPINIRGGMGVLHQFGLTIGIMVSQVFGLKEFLGTEALWPVLLAFVAFPAFVCLVVLPFVPDSPRYLLIKCNNEDAAREALTKYRGTDMINLDIQEMRQEQELMKQEPEWSFKELLMQKGLRGPLSVLVALAMCQQLSGINVVFYYSNGVFLAAGIPEDKTPYAVLGTGIINVVMTAISIPLVEKSGRRPLLLGGMVVMFLSEVLITVALLLQPQFPWTAYVSLLFTIVFVIGFAIGLGSIPQFIGAELFKQGPRPPAMSIAGLLNWLCNFIVGITFPSIARGMGPYSFTLFIAAIFLFGIYIFKKLPESKNKTYEDLYRHFKVPNPEIAGSRLSLNIPNGTSVGAKKSNPLEVDVLLKNASKMNKWPSLSGGLDKDEKGAEPLLHHSATAPEI